MEQVPRPKPHKKDEELIAHRIALPLMARAVLNMELMSKDPKRRPEQRKKYGAVARDWYVNQLDDYSRKRLDEFKRWEITRNVRP